MYVVIKMIPMCSAGLDLCQNSSVCKPLHLHCSYICFQKSVAPPIFYNISVPHTAESLILRDAGFKEVKPYHTESVGGSIETQYNMLTTKTGGKTAEKYHRKKEVTV